jgi:hypothetical protein
MRENAMGLGMQSLRTKCDTVCGCSVAIFGIAVSLVHLSLVRRCVFVICSSDGEAFEMA